LGVYRAIYPSIIARMPYTPHLFAHVY
jgi:hypothetical protein